MNESPPGVAESADRQRPSPAGSSGPIGAVVALAWLALACGPASAGRQPATSVALLAACPETAGGCIRMSLDAVDLASVLARPPGPLPGGQSEFVLRPHVVLPTGSDPSRTVSVRGYADGLGCSAFGQATVAVVAISRQGDPVLLAEDGERTVDGSLLRVGCPECAVLLPRELAGDARAMRAASEDGSPAARTPAWDMHLVGARLASYGDDGSLVIEQGAACLRLPRDGRVERLSREVCRTRLDEVSLVERETARGGRDRALWSSFVPGRRHVLVREGGACT